MSFRYGQEVRAPRQLVLLVHPDCIFEQGEDAFDRYAARISPYLRDKTVFIHWFYSHEFPRILSEWESENDHSTKVQFYTHVRSYFAKLADVAKWDKGSYGSTFNDELASWIIESPGGLIQIGGGYEDLCVAETARRLGWHLRDELEEMKVKVTVVPALCFRRG